MRDRSRLISIEISKKAKGIYDQQQHKGEFVSEAIIEKASKTQPFTQEQETRVREIVKDVMKE